MFIISKEQKNKLEDYIDKFDKTTDEYRDVKVLFEKLINFLKRMFHRKDKEDVYAEVVGGLYDNKIISEKAFDTTTGWDKTKITKR